MHSFESQLDAQLAGHDWQRVTAAVAVSGGADSVALLRGLANLHQRSPGRLVVLHLNHRLRGAASTADAEFVAELAAKLGLHCLIGEAEPNAIGRQGDSLEAAARDARYRFFEQAANELGARYLFTAHTADDQSETVLHRIVRGTGIGGLAGIPAVRAISPLTTIVRPMLRVRRAEVVAYLDELGQPFQTDHTNSDLQFTRNRLRHDLLPKLAAEYNPNIREALLRLSELAAEATTRIDGLVERLAIECMAATNQGVRIATNRLAGQPAYVVRQLLIHIWQQQQWPLQAMTFDKWQQLAALATGNSDGSLNLPGDVRAKKQGEQLMLTRPAKDD